MKKVYPVLLTPDSGGYIVYVPNFDINTEGDTLAEALEMARDAIGIIGIDMEDDGKAIPEGSEISAIRKETEDQIVALVDVDFSEYRRKNDLRMVRRNVTLPSWLNEAAIEANVNVSAILQNALKQELNITR